MVELHVNVNYEGLTNYKDHSTLGTCVQNKTMEGEASYKLIYVVWLQLFILKIDTHGHRVCKGAWKWNRGYSGHSKSRPISWILLEHFLWNIFIYSPH